MVRSAVLRIPATLRLIALAAAVALAGCVSDDTLAPTPAIYAGKAARSQYDGAAAPKDFDLLYVTNRDETKAPDGTVAYGTGRSRTLSFGTVDVEVVDQKSQRDLVVGAIHPIGAFPQSPYSVSVVKAGYRRSPQAVTEHEAARKALQKEVAVRVAASRRKEVVIFVHGYNNTFVDAARSTANICNFLGAEFVCVSMSWPAGGSGGAFFGYNIDRESGEFAVPDFRKAIRAIAEVPNVRKIHIIAHSRGTDVVMSAIQQLGIEAYAANDILPKRIKIANLVLFAPDIDLDVAASKIFGLSSDPDMLRGRHANPNAVLDLSGFHLTVYSSPDDVALSLSRALFGSLIRLGQLDISMPRPKNSDLPKEPPHFAGLADFIEFKGGGGLGHDYFLSNPKVSADLVALVRYGLKPGTPGRPLIEIRPAFWEIPSG